MRTIAEDEQALDPATVAMAKALMPLAWQSDEGPHMRRISLRIAERAREQFKIERESADAMVYEMGALHARRDAEEQHRLREASPGYHWRGFWRAVFRRKPKPDPLCPHRVGWDDCPVCSH